MGTIEEFINEMAKCIMENKCSLPFFQQKKYKNESGKEKTIYIANFIANKNRDLISVLVKSLFFSEREKGFEPSTLSLGS